MLVVCGNGGKEAHKLSVCRAAVGRWMSAHVP